MRIIKQSPSAVTTAVSVLKSGGLVVFPSETVYGIAADATNPKAIKKLNIYKKRPFGKPYSIAVANRTMAEKYAKLNPTAKNLYKRFLPGPMTVISKGRGKLAKGVESEARTVGVRIPAYPLVINIIKKLKTPITATSANASYKKRPYKIEDIFSHISAKQKRLIDLVIDAGTLPTREPSTVIDTTPDDPVVLRQGEIKLKNNDSILSRSPENTQNLGKELWQKYSHYAGKRPLIFALEGEMGAGKTQLTKGLGKAMGISEKIISPTFNLVLEYGKLTHIDAWRLQNPGELAGLGFIELIEDNNSVIVIEWAERVADLILKYRDQATIVWVKIKYGKAENDRLLSWGTI